MRTHPPDTSSRAPSRHLDKMKLAIIILTLLYAGCSNHKIANKGSIFLTPAEYKIAVDVYDTCVEITKSQGDDPKHCKPPDPEAFNVSSRAPSSEED